MSWSCTRGVVLKVGGYGEADKLVNLYSPDLGLITAIAKGASRSTRRFVNKLELFSSLSIEYRAPRTGSLFFLNQAELDEGFLPLRQDYHRYLYGACLSELVLRFSRELNPEPQTYRLLLWSLHRLACSGDGLATLTFFLLKFLDTCGYRPVLDSCGLCGTPILPAARHPLLPGSGLLLCPRCNRGHGTAVSFLSGRTLAFLGHAQHLELYHLDRLRIPGTCVAEALTFLHRYCQRLLQREITSLQLLGTLLSPDGKETRGPRDAPCRRPDRSSWPQPAPCP